MPSSLIPFAQNFCVALVSLSNPAKIYADAASTFSNYNFADVDNTITTTPEDAAPTVNPIVTEDSDDDLDNEDILSIPDDIAKLMQDAESKLDPAKSVGKTSEESYQGGGKIVSSGDIQIQSKIPSSFYELNIDSLLSQDCRLSISDKSKPTVLIYHSHTTESYALLDVGYYISSDSHSRDCSRNMVRVGDELARYLEKAGFNVIHDKRIHDTAYNSSYDDSLKSVQKYLEKYPTIDITIDVHRDSVTYKDKTKVKPTTVINGKKAARMMIISGCEYGRVKNFPDWEHNLRFNLQIQSKVNHLYPDLMRPILFSERKYNMNMTHYSFLLEIGTDANTLDEACYSARLFGKSLGELLNDKYVK